MERHNIVQRKRKIKEMGITEKKKKKTDEDHTIALKGWGGGEGV